MLHGTDKLKPAQTSPKQCAKSGFLLHDAQQAGYPWFHDQAAEQVWGGTYRPWNAYWEKWTQ